MALSRVHKASHSGSTSSSPSGLGYDVFLSFRGEDNRKNFTDHLYTALVNARFRTFRDDDELERGENIKEKLENAIRQSRSSVIVFSKDYTSSRWCLDELVMILQLKRTSDHVVLPVFYDVDPSQVRKQAETLSKVPKYQENQSSEKLNGWRAALREVADLAGMVLQNEADGHEAKFIKKIVRVIREKLGGVPLSDVQKKLEDKLLSVSVNPALDDAEGKQLKFKTTVKPWLHKLKEAVYEAEDLLQEIKTEALRQKIEHECGSSTSKVQELISTPPSHAFDPALIYPKVKEVLERLDFLMEQRRDVWGMEASAGHRVSQTLPSTCLVEDCVYGRDEEKETFVNLLLSDNETSNKLSVIPILGMAGIGKTTLAQFLYNDVKVKRHFDLRVWASISEEFDVIRITQDICESLSLGASSRNLNLLQSKLQTALTGKKFLLVLDDIWNEIYHLWDSLKRPFESGAHGSKIIVTTRNQNVAAMMGTLRPQPHCLMPISEEDGWLLFEKHAFKNAGVDAFPNFEVTGRKIIKNCNGLPLALKSLGGLLCSKLTCEEWESILNSDMWELPQESHIMPSLWFSYLYLPLHLKHCFAYCSIFPKNYRFQKLELVLLWKAQGLLQATNKKMVEAIGEEYFNDLISRSFFQRSSSSEYFIMHDLINDLASFVSGDFCIRWEGSDSPNILSKTRHFSYKRNYGYDDIKIFEDLQQAKYLRTFLMKSTSSKGLDELLPRLQCLRMLNLSGLIRELPDSINNLKLLRHLDLSSSRITRLPDTICTLYNMQVLLLSWCQHLTELPANLGRLINLSHLDITGTKLKKMPPQMGKLKDLQMLTEFVLDKHTAVDNLPELKKLQNLRGRLCISGLVHSSGLEAYILRDKKFLKELLLDWGVMDWTGWPSRGRDSSEQGNRGNPTLEEREVLEKLQPHLNLERLTIEGYGGKMFPGWSGYYSSSALVYLELANCENCISLPPLGQLPSRRELHIEWLSGWQKWSDVGGDNNEGGVFPNLEELVLSCCPNLTGRLASHSLPSLESLSVWDCPEFECFPEDGFPSKLKSLDIRNCKKVNAKCMQNLNKGLRTLTSLERLLLDFDCDEKVGWFAEEEEEGLFPSTLTYLQIHRLNCETIHGARWFGHLNSLRQLIISDCPALQCLLDSGLPSSLRDLRIWDCPALQCLPDGGLPSSLRDLRIWRCPALQCLPDSGLPTALFHLRIDECPLLEKRCQRETGEDWPKIAHIPLIMID